MHKYTGLDVRTWGSNYQLDNGKWIFCTYRYQRLTVHTGLVNEFSVGIYWIDKNLN